MFGGSPAPQAREDLRPRARHGRCARLRLVGTGDERHGGDRDEGDEAHGGSLRGSCEHSVRESDHTIRRSGPAPIRCDIVAS